MIYRTPFVGTTKNVVITVRPTPILADNQTKTICSGENVNLEILLNPANTPAGVTFSWPDPDGPGPATSRVNVPEGPADHERVAAARQNTGQQPVAVVIDSRFPGAPR